MREMASRSALTTSDTPLRWALPGMSGARAGLGGPGPSTGALVGGAALVAAGAALRLCSIRWLGKRARVSRAKVTVLVARGPYARVRNPLYVAALLVLAGLGLMTGLGAWALTPVAAVWLIYDRVVRHEERTLAGAHGELGAAYLRSVPRWLPLRRPFDGPEVEREPWPEVLAREWRLLLGLPAAALGLATLALTPAGRALGGEAAALAAALDASLPVLIALGAALGAVGNAIKTEHDLARKARRRALVAAAQGGAPLEHRDHDALSVAPEAAAGRAS